MKDDTEKKTPPAGKNKPVNSRRETREAVLKVLYAYEFTQNNIHSIISDLCDNFSEPALVMIRRLSFTCIQRQEDLDRHIRSFAENWSFERIAIIDRILIRIGLCELIHFEEIPVKVTISEIISIAKRFSTHKSSAFINGILDKASKDLQQSGEIRKTGMGMIQTSKQL
jgi:transcription antitermination protein NusB